MKHVMLFILLSILAIVFTSIMDWVMGWQTDTNFIFILVVMLYLDITKENKDRWNN